MSGWWIVVDPRTPAERDASDDKLSHLIASWGANVFNVRWLKSLVSEGRAKQHSFSGYPNRFTASAADILPVIAELADPASAGVTDVTIHKEKLSFIPSDHILTIDVWDIS